MECEDTEHGITDNGCCSGMDWRCGGKGCDKIRCIVKRTSFLYRKG